jgi:SsrA-binding protein
MSPRPQGIHVVARNRKARHEFSIEDTYEAGLVLVGAEVKSLRTGDCSINEAFARPREDELYLFDMHIAPYAQASVDRPEPKRPRKLLLHRKELARIISQVSQKGYTLVPLSVYFKAGYAKVEIALARRRKLHDKRRASEERQRREDVRRELGRRR